MKIIYSHEDDILSEESIAKKLMKDDLQRNNDIKASDLITGMNIDVNDLISNLQKEVDKIYRY